MPKILDQPRYKCALGAMQTVHSITKALPILHSGPGCADKLSGSQGGSGHFAPRIFPCTNLNEKDVIFGGEEGLRDVITNALKIVNADLYVVLSGCSSEIVGDDMQEVVRSFKDAEKPVVFASTAGFKGNNFLGHEWVIQAIIEQYLKPADKKAKGLVNIWASVPQHDPFWYGNLFELENLITQLGLTPNTIFGYDRGIKNIDRIQEAEFNLLVSPWVGLSNVKLLEEKFQTPYLHLSTLPIGAFETSKFLREVGDFAGIDKEKVENIITENEKKYYYFIERFADVFLETRIMSKRFVVISDAQYSLAITKFLVNDVGLFPSKQYITDNAPEEYQEAIKGYFKDLNWNIEAEVAFLSDGHLIQNEIKETYFSGYPLIIGSSWDKKVAEQTQAHYLSVSWPVNERLVINSSYVGYGGGLKLLEDIYSVVLTRFN